MAVVDGEVLGSISGGCVESAVYEVCTAVATGEPVVERFGYDDDDAFAVGLTCGGEIDVLVSRVDPDDAPAWEAIAQAASGGGTAIALVLGDRARGTVLSVHSSEEDFARAGIGPDEARRTRNRLVGAAETGTTQHMVLDCDGEPLELLIVGAATPPRMILFGAVDYSVALAEVAAPLGFRVTVCDPRPLFADPRRFPASTDVIVRWPVDYLAEQQLDARTVVCLLGHDDRYDAEVLADALTRDLAYVGAMGSRVTHEARVLRLRALDVPAAALAALHSPIGLDLGASTPYETAVSVVAEIIASRSRASGASLRSTFGPIHRSMSAG